jgi:insecticidal toxin complex protein TccC
MDPRGLAVRAVQFHRRQAADPVEARVTHQRFDASGRPVASRDPYLFALAQSDGLVPANVSQVFSLSGAQLSSDSVDAGWRVALHGAAGQRVEAWDGRGSHSFTEIDELLRPVAVHEDGESVAEHVLERFTYAGVDADAASRNLCGQLIRHDDPAGTVHLKELGIGGAVLQQTRHFLRDANVVNWPRDVHERDALLEPGDGATTSQAYAPSAELLRQTDALGNRQHFAYTVAGELKNTRLALAGEGPTERTLFSYLHYNASGQIETETAGNGVITRHRYDLADGRLIGLSAHKADGTPLQDLRYNYDATGNVLSLEDAAQAIRYFNNQRIEPIKTYRYDTLDQLVEASGWEAKTGHGGPALPDLQPLPLDPSQVANYTQTYHYDAGGNLLNLVHVGAQAHGRTLTRARYSNRCLPERNGRPPTEAELAAGFDANGNLRELQIGQALEWDLRNQLTVVRPVVRASAEDDYERYIYDGGGQRVRKLRANQTSARTLISEVRYLPGVEIRSHGGTGEILHVITASAGSNSVQVLHWVAQKPGDIANDQVRYSLNDHLQSSTMELDQNANLISQEWYYPYGGTACFAARSDTEAKYKTVRYSGKERDATGLYYYGFRYYVPWLQRWINPDPAGYVDGINLFAFVSNSPAGSFDPNGRNRKKINKNSVEKEAALAQKKSEFYNANVSALNDWKNLPKNLSLTHSLKLDRLTHSTTSPLLFKEASSVLSSWDVISTSLVDFNSRKTETKTYRATSAFAGEFAGMIVFDDEDSSNYLSANDITFGEIVFKLKVNPSNIIGTSPFDLWFPNHAGFPYNTVQLGQEPPKLTIEQAGELSKAVFSGASLDNLIEEHLQTHYSVLTPNSLLTQQQSLGTTYNEVLIAGKKDVSIHMGMPNTKAITVEEIVVLPHGDVRLDKNNKPIYRQDLLNVVEQLKSVNPHIKISFG